MALDFLKNFFTTSGKSKMSMYKLHTSLRDWQHKKTYPYAHDLPDIIYFDKDFWNKILKLYRYTLSDSHEREISVFWADGELIFTGDNKGSTTSVTSNHQVKVAYEPTHDPKYLKKTVYLDGDIYNSKKIYHKKRPKKLEIDYLFNLHTHPPHRRQGKTYYSFFSAQDIKSLIKSEAIITTMVGDKLWLLVQTKLTPTYVDKLTDDQIDIDFLRNELKLEIYKGEFKKRLHRVEPLLPNRN